MCVHHVWAGRDEGEGGRGFACVRVGGWVVVMVVVVPGEMKHAHVAPYLQFHSHAFCRPRARTHIILPQQGGRAGSASPGSGWRRSPAMGA